MMPDELKDRLEDVSRIVEFFVINDNYTPLLDYLIEKLPRLHEADEYADEIRGLEQEIASLEDDLSECKEYEELCMEKDRTIESLEKKIKTLEEDNANLFKKNKDLEQELETIHYDKREVRL